MSVTCHHALVFTTNVDADLEAVHRKATALFPWVSPISPPQANGYRSFLCPPDGGKEGNPFSRDGDARRHDLLAWLTEALGADGQPLCVDWCEVAFGADAPQTGDRLLRTNGVDVRSEQDRRLEPDGDRRDYLTCPTCGYRFVVYSYEPQGEFEGAVIVSGYEELDGGLVVCPCCDEEGRETRFEHRPSLGGWVREGTPAAPLGARSRLAPLAG